MAELGETAEDVVAQFSVTLFTLTAVISHISLSVFLTAVRKTDNEIKLYSLYVSCTNVPLQLRSCGLSTCLYYRHFIPDIDYSSIVDLYFYIPLKTCDWLVGWLAVVTLNNPSDYWANGLLTLTLTLT